MPVIAVLSLALLAATPQERALDVELPIPARIEALQSLAELPFEERAETLYALLSATHPPAIQSAALDQCLEEASPAVAEHLAGQWFKLGPALRPETGQFLLRSENRDILRAAIQEGDIAPGELNLSNELRADIAPPDQDSPAQQDFKAARAALDLKGDAYWGQQLFQTRCSQCHQFIGMGEELAPDLSKSFEQDSLDLLRDTLVPNAAIPPEYIEYMIETTDDESYSGVVTREDDNSITLRNTVGRETSIPRSTIADFRSSGISPMPEDLALGLESQDIADLLAYLQKKP